MTLDSLATPQLLTDQDLYLFNEGSNYRLYEKMGLTSSRTTARPGLSSAVGSECPLGIGCGKLNEWDPKTHRLSPRGSSGIWEGFLPGVTRGALYKFHIESQRLA